MILLKWNSDYVTLVSKPIQGLHTSLAVKAQALIMVHKILHDLAFYLASPSTLPPFVHPLVGVLTSYLFSGPYTCCSFCQGHFPQIPLTSFKFLLKCHKWADHSRSFKIKCHLLPEPPSSVPILFFPRALITVWPSNYLCLLSEPTPGTWATKAFSISDLFPLPVIMSVWVQ